MKTIKLIVFVLGLAVVSIALIFNVKLLQNSANSTLQPPGAISSPHKCFPTPQPRAFTGTSTPTPNADQFGTAPIPEATNTPLPAKITDLTPGLAEEDKVRVMVMHCNGTFELFLIDPNVYRTQATPYFLKPDDFILYLIPPPSMMGHQAPPYPPPGTPYP